MITSINFIHSMTHYWSRAQIKRLIEKIFYFLHLDFNLNFDSHLLSLNLHLCSNLSSQIGNHTLQVSSMHFFIKSFNILTPSLILYMHLLIESVDKYNFLGAYFPNKKALT